LAIEVLDAILPFFFIEVKYDLGIGACGKGVSLSQEIFFEFEVIEDLAVKSDPERGVLVAHRLMAAREIKDAETGMRESYAILDVNS